MPTPKRANTIARISAKAWGPRRRWRQPVRQGVRFAAMFLGRDLIDSVVQIAQRLLPRGLVFRMEGQQFVENVVAFTQAGVVEDLTARHHVEGDAAEA